MLTSTIFLVHASSSLNITVTTDFQSYHKLSQVKVSSKLTLDALPKSDALVALLIQDPNNGNSVIRTLGNTQENPLLVNIESIVPCALSGTPQSIFQPGSLAYFNVTFGNYDVEPRTVLITVNLFDYNNYVLDHGSVTLQVPARNRTWALIGVNIPSWATHGSAFAYANAYSGWINSGGKAYCKETSAQFYVTAQSQAGPASAFVGNGWYNLTFKLPQTSIMGNYKVYASSTYGEYDEYYAIQNTVFLVNYQGDFNGDGSVDYTDIIAFVDAYVAYNEGVYNPQMDFNNDGKIDYNDITAFVDDYINANSP